MVIVVGMSHRRWPSSMTLMARAKGELQTWRKQKSSTEETVTIIKLLLFNFSDLYNISYIVSYIVSVATMLPSCYGYTARQTTSLCFWVVSDLDPLHTRAAPAMRALQDGRTKEVSILVNGTICTSTGVARHEQRIAPLLVQDAFCAAAHSPPLKRQWGCRQACRQLRWPGQCKISATVTYILHRPGVHRA